MLTIGVARIADGLGRYRFPWRRSATQFDKPHRSKTTPLHDLAIFTTNSDRFDLNNENMIPRILTLAASGLLLAGQVLAGYDPALVGTWSTKSKSVITGPVSGAQVS